ncbi:hypothetical protein [Vibrio paucivorans]|uniref:Uncharacterized protein n=1 Tax=Vibrio paucivorans TaxID=2829489 RepID=A0A9X3CH25_9VIBR|nr:hypothetical protein [Vibrio paucivorans]MCW8335631.1 hypothetical protein [Vibrio paucivorans]
MSIKNWYVRNESIKNKAQGCLAYAHYLKDPKHPNHKNKTTIEIIHNSPVNVALLAIEQAYEADLKNQSKGKGGRSISSFMQSFVFSLPDNIELSSEEWKEISKEILIELAIKMGIEPKLLLKYSSFVLHKQSNTHLNVIISRNIEGKSFQQLLTRPSATNLLKKAFNASVLKCGYDFKDYKPKRRPNRKLKRWEELKEKEEYVSVKKVELKEVENKIQLANKQLAKLKVAIEDNNNKDLNRQKNRLNRTIEKIEPTSYEETYEKQLQELREEIERIEPLTNKPILTIKNRIKMTRK